MCSNVHTELAVVKANPAITMTVNSANAYVQIVEVAVRPIGYKTVSPSRDAFQSVEVMTNGRNCFLFLALAPAKTRTKISLQSCHKNSPFSQSFIVNS